MNLIGFKRDWTTEFYDYRSSVFGSSIMENTVQSVVQIQQTQWSQTVEDIKSKIRNTQFKLEELDRLQKKYLSIDLDDYDNIGKQVESKTNEIKLVCFYLFIFILFN